LNARHYIQVRPLALRPYNGQHFLASHGHEEIGIGSNRAHSAVPHYLPGKSPFLGEFARKYGIPIEAANGGAETTYPEYLQRLKTLPVPKPDDK
jgi:hypothetical protein